MFFANFIKRLFGQQPSISDLEHLGSDALAQVCAMLPICDLAHLQQTNRGLRDVAAASWQWDLAAKALETEYPPPNKFIDGDYVETYNECNEWREEHDPRAKYTRAEWNALPPKSRFVDMIPLCIFLVEELKTAATHVWKNYLIGVSWGGDRNELEQKNHQVFQDFKASGHLEDVAVLAAQAYFEHELRSAKDNEDNLAYDVESMLVDRSHFPGGSFGARAINEYYYPPFYCIDIDDFDLLPFIPGSPEHVEWLLDPDLPFTETERVLLGTGLVDLMRFNLEAPSWHTPP